MIDYKLKIREAMLTFRDELEAGLKHAEEVEKEIRFLERHCMDMYPAVPTETWESRGLDRRYMYMIFPCIEGQYQGPDGQRKLYIGNKPENIGLARRRAADRERYEQLLKVREAHEKWLILLAMRAGGLAAMAEDRPNGVFRGEHEENS